MKRLIVSASDFSVIVVMVAKLVLGTMVCVPFVAVPAEFSATAFSKTVGWRRWVLRDHRAMKSASTPQFKLRVVAIFVMAILVSACGDQTPPEKNGEGQSPSTGEPQDETSLHLDSPVTHYEHESQLSSHIFHVPIETRAIAIEALAAEHKDLLRDVAMVEPLRAIMVNELMALREFNLELAKKLLSVQRISRSDKSGEILTLKVKGSDSSRCFIIAVGAMERKTNAGPGSFAMEIASGLEVMRVFATTRIMERPEALPFDLELVVLTQPDPTMGFVKDVVKKNRVLGVLCLEEITPAKPGGRELFLQIVPGQSSTLRNAVQDTLRDYLAKSYAWDSASLSADLPAVSASVCKSLGQTFVPYCVLRASSSAENRSLIPPKDFKALRRTRKEYVSAHPTVGTKADRLKAVCDEKFKTCIAISRCVTISVNRLRTAFP